LTFGGEDIGWEGALATIVEDPDSKVFRRALRHDLVGENNLTGGRAPSSGAQEESVAGWSAYHRTPQPIPSWRWLDCAGRLVDGGLPSLRCPTQELMSDAAEIAGAPSDYVA